ncbi:CDP-diacylglycerol--serine O-phosphatidyltransferase [Pelagibius litoralis]|uniref:CDP-diacylglycerol--serine O-phosphatidyltransferase n=1 Tax=Pelagibius litoralis TaxID=374515 RepID=A0A967F0N2_9PROT|nr:CDP-diacylglycerol--serine O-phosphatidyltransferase [Pelagibius litoralis]NIA70897.1 CDP-diacylglycerol--serine O-phosphatidyltransferase [Pelagibius litoralis]
MARLRRRRVSALSINRMIPNALTLLALCAGLTAVRLALQERWEIAVGAVVVAMLLDGLDGRIARLMGATSDFGAQLDSLSDVISFGVTPALMIYLWTLSDAGGLGWATCLVFAACCALRLARFNAALGDENPPPLAARYFVGVPAPAAAGLVLLPMTMSFVFGDTVLRSDALNLLTLLIVAFLMVSQVPTFSAKRLKLRKPHWRFAMLGLVGFAAILISEPWVTVTIVGLAYLVSIPLAVVQYRREVKTIGLDSPAEPQPDPDNTTED